MLLTIKKRYEIALFYNYIFENTISTFPLKFILTVDTKSDTFLNKFLVSSWKTSFLIRNFLIKKWIIQLIFYLTKHVKFLEMFSIKNQSNNLILVTSHP